MIKQRYEKDCGVACLAMLCKVSYEEAYKALALEETINISPIDFNTHGVTDQEFIRAGKKLGKKLVRLLDDGCFDSVCGVPSLNLVGGGHYIYKQIYRNPNHQFEIHDPSNKKTYGPDVVLKTRTYSVIADSEDELVRDYMELTIQDYQEALQREEKSADNI